jgi:aspartate ammonia-lyase
LRVARGKLCSIPLGGTALGTGIAAHPDFARNVAMELSKMTKDRIETAYNKPLLISNMNDFLEYSGALRCLSVSLVKIANDFKLLVSGPNAGIAEIIIPEVEPGSSIMPGKVNPSIPEALEIIAKDAISSDTGVLLACAGGQLQLNFLTPLIAKNTIEPTLALTGAIKMFNESCAKELKYDLARCDELVNKTYIFATALNPYLGYQVVAEIVKESLSTRKSVSEVVLSQGLLTKDELSILLDPSRLTSPAPYDAELVKKVKSAPAYINYLKKIGKN